ncbi:inositol monophosphatase [Candidatus Roizmanbacteria bacterium]|nr:inositol monophosphatase [Candidatus Roizmanbacteria bacterium]
MLEVIQRAAREAGKLLLTYFQKGIKVTYKTNSHKNIVTKADLESQNLIQHLISKDMLKRGYKQNEIGFISEENLVIRGKYTFIIDPLDGTNNFASGLDYWAVSIGCVLNREIISGVIYNPALDEEFSAEKNKDAFKMAKKIKTRLVIKKIPLKNSLVAVIFNRDQKIFNQELKIIKNIFPHIRASRIVGSSSIDLAKVAENVMGAEINGHCYIWDIAAGKLIVEESGGILTDWDGKPLILNLNDSQHSYQSVACHPKLLPEILKFF